LTDSKCLLNQILTWRLYFSYIRLQ